MKLTSEVQSKLRLNNSQDSNRLFNAVWRKIKWFNENSEIDDLQGLYDTIVSEKVNNPKSPFYMYG